MLRRLTVENYALIERLDLELDSHLNIITGETGAGKSILLGALGLLLGNKNESGTLRDESRSCIIEGTSSVSVMAWELEYTDTTIDEWWELNQGEIQAVFQNFELETSENTTVNDLYAKKYIYTASLGEYNYKIMQVACVKNSTVYLFTYTSTDKLFDSHLDEVNKILEYFSLK